MSGYRRAGSGVLGVIGPSIAVSFTGDFGGLEGDRRIAGTVQAFGTLLANTQTPRGIISCGQQQDREVLGLRRRGGGRSGGWALWPGRRLRWRVARCRSA